MLVLYEVSVENSVEVYGKALDGIPPTASVPLINSEYQNKSVCPDRQADFIIVTKKPRPLKAVDSGIGVRAY